MTTLVAKEVFSAVPHKAPTKAKAFDMLVKAIEEGTLNKEAAASLYRYFMPKPRKPSTTFAWVAMAASSDADRKHINNVIVHNGTMYATDNHRVHAAPTALEDGSYNPVSGALLPDAKSDTFPIGKILEIMDPGASPYISEFVVSKKEVVRDGKSSNAYRISARLGLNALYVDAAFNGAGSAMVRTGGEESPKVFDLGDRTAVIMPLRL